jgi:hypothetical protein
VLKHLRHVTSPETSSFVGTKRNSTRKGVQAETKMPATPETKPGRGRAATMT